MGTAFGMGSVYLDIVESYQTTRPLAAMVQSLASGLGFGAGIITGPVIGHVGGAATMVAGSLLCCVGCIGSSLAPNIYVVIVCFGAVTGFGVSCCFLSASVIAGTSFQKNSKVVLPVVSMSGGVGMTVFPYMLRWLVDEFTLKGMFLILAGVSLNSVLFGIVIKVFDASRDPAPGEDELEIHVEEVTVSERQIGKESRRRISMYDEETGIVTKSHSKISICKEEIHAAMESENTEKGRCKKLTKEKSVLDDNEETSDLENVSDVSSNIIMHSPGEGDISDEHFQEDRNETRRQAENGSASHTRQNGMVTERRSEQERKEVPYNEHGRNKDMMSKTLSRRGHINVSFENDVDDMETALHVDEWNRHQEPRGMIKESSAVSLSKKVQISR
ncbi:hypothetical protein V1264_009369 [Littorina saxatilis]|uniref:Uncharacterized protein n=1 Tax=Littorina saxatilis TaxID=31220 RepID=A0AAN9ARL3_9CAEN